LVKIRPAAFEKNRGFLTGTSYVVRLLKEIADELRHIRRYLEGVSGELEKISGPLGDVQKLYGLGERVLGRSEEK
jgi:hypothetical protein